MPRRTNYAPPSTIASAGLWELLRDVRSVPAASLHLFEAEGTAKGPTVWYAGDAGLVRKRCVAIVGSREASPEGRQRAARLAKELVQAGVVVVSGLAKGIDHAAHESAIKHGGRTIAVIGTPLDKAYPAENAPLQELIHREHLLLSPFEIGSSVHKGNFPERNRIMAALTDATVIIEAGDTSGTLHQAAECGPKRSHRYLFIAKSIIDRPDVTWPAKFLDAAKRGALVKVLERTEDLLEVLKCPRPS